MKRHKEASSYLQRKAKAVAARPAPTPAAAAKSRKKRLWLWGLAGVCTLVLAYLAATGKLISNADWQMATAGIRNWFRPAPEPPDDPEEKAVPVLNTTAAPGPAPAADMVWIPGGWYWRGNAEFPDAVPLRKVYVDGFWMAKTELTTAQWREFVKETGYKTIAERQPNLKDFPRLMPEALGFQPQYIALFAATPDLGFPAGLPWGATFHSWPALAPFSLVFTKPDKPLPHLHDHSAWWRDVPGASWEYPLGKADGTKAADNHPAVHISWVDATAYCEWRSKKTGKKFRLPTEAEWEFAARGGLDRKLYSWGDEETVDGKWQCNIWQGEFPMRNLKSDGFEGIAPVAQYPANAYGLHDMAGNVWEWCSDWYSPDYYKDSPRENPKGPKTSFDPREPGTPKRVQRGGSFLCCDNYCVRYIAGARGKGEPTSAANHIGFRLACSP